MRKSQQCEVHRAATGANTSIPGRWFTPAPWGQKLLHSGPSHTSPYVYLHLYPLSCPLMVTISLSLSSILILSSYMTLSKLIYSLSLNFGKLGIRIPSPSIPIWIKEIIHTRLFAISMQQVLANYSRYSAAKNYLKNLSKMTQHTRQTGSEWPCSQSFALSWDLDSWYDEVQDETGPFQQKSCQFLWCSLIEN